MRAPICIGIESRRRQPRRASQTHSRFTNDDTHLQCSTPETLELLVGLLIQGFPVDGVDAVAGVGCGDVVRHGELEGRLPGFRDLEGAHHREDGAPPLDGTHRAGHVGAAVAHAVDMVEDGDNSGRAEEEVALCPLVASGRAHVEKTQ